jgi:hypothetical protein
VREAFSKIISSTLIINSRDQINEVRRVFLFLCRAKMSEILLDILRSEDHKPDRRLLTKVTAQLVVGMPDPHARVDAVVEMLGELYNPYVQPQRELSAPALTDAQKRAITLSVRVQNTFLASQNKHHFAPVDCPSENESLQPANHS